MFFEAEPYHKAVSCMPKHRHSPIVLVGYDAESMLSLQPYSHPESRLVSASASFDPFYSLARTQCTSSQLNRDCQTSRRPRNTAWASPSAYFNLLTTYHPLGFDYYLHLSLPLLHSNQPHSSSNSNTTQSRRPQQTNQPSPSPQNTAIMQFTNYALTVLLPALVAAQGGAESVGQEIGQGLGAVSFLPRPSQIPEHI